MIYLVEIYAILSYQQHVTYIIFLSRPPMFVPRSKLSSISCGRGSGGSRYVDMMVQLDTSANEEDDTKKTKQSDSLEFTNIHRDELNGLNDYIHKTLIPAMQMDADGSGKGSDEDDEAVVAEVVNTSDDDNMEDGSNDGSEEEEDEGSSKKRRPSRAASKSAREINRAALMSAPVQGGDEDDDSDDSEEFEDESESDSDSGSDDDKSICNESSEDAEFVEEMDDSDDGSEYDSDRKSKKARVE